MQSYNTTNCDEQPDEENQHHSNFAFCAPGLQGYQVGDREEEHNQIEDDVQRCISVCGRFDVEAHALVFAVPLIPGVVQRSALEDERDQEAEAIGEHGGDDGPADVMEARRDFSGEDAEV